MLSNPIGRLRLVALTEGASFVLLLGVAMPLKYLADQPAMVRVVGMAHGVLFVAFCLALFLAARHARWGMSRVVEVFVASLLPLGPFFLDRGLRKEEERLTSAAADQAGGTN